MKYTEEFEFMSFIAFSLVHVIPLEVCMSREFYPCTIAKEFDEKDTPFTALALKLDIPIWTGDKRMVECSRKSGKFMAIELLENFAVPYNF